MNSDVKFTLGVVFATLVFIIGGILVANKINSSKSAGIVDPEILLREDSYKISSPSASVNLVEFSDFECPACGVYHPIVKRLVEDYKGKINFIYRHFPLQQHKNATPASIAAEAAGKQGKYWDMFDMLFDKQSEWSTSTNPDEIFQTYAIKLKLDTEKYKKDLNLDEIKKKIQRDYDDGIKAGVDATPTFFVNNMKLANNPSSYEDFRKIIEEALKKNLNSVSPSNK